jgi:RNA polymerase sigma-70 factor (ECF subfamily)
LRHDEADRDPPEFSVFRNWFGFVPNLLLPRALLPRLIDAEAEIAAAFLFQERALTRVQKELILLAVAGACEDGYGTALHFRMLLALGFSREQLNDVLSDYRQAGLPETDLALLDFALRLGRLPALITPPDVEALRARGFSDEHILETVLTTSWGSYLCALSAGLGVEPDFEPPAVRFGAARGNTFERPASRSAMESGGPYVRTVELQPESFPPFTFVKQKWGFIPKLFQAQTLWPDLVEAELRAIDLWLLTGDVLSPRQKECIFLAVSAANLNTYCVAAHCEILRGLGVSEEQSERIALDHHQAGLSGADQALLDVCLRLVRRPARFGEADIAVLREHAFSEPQILEAVTIVAVANFINTLNVGLGVEPDFEPRIPLGGQKVYLSPAGGDPMDETAQRAGREQRQDDPDAAFVARVQTGDAEAFEELVRRHGRRVQRTLAGILRQNEDIEDAVQDAFLKAFQNIGKFRGHSWFSTWLTRIAINTGLQRLRRRKEFESLDGPENEDGFRPRQVQAWEDDPEESYSKAEIRQMTWDALKRLPLKYRVVVMLRDLQQLSTKETASALGLQLPAVKIRLFRGRLMLREALSPYFARKSTERLHV